MSQQVEFCAQTECFHNEGSVCICCGDLRDPGKGEDCPYYEPD